MNRVVAQLADFKEGLDGIGSALAQAKDSASVERISQALEQLTALVREQASRPEVVESDREKPGAELQVGLDPSSLQVINSLVATIEDLIERVAVHDNQK